MATQKGTIIVRGKVGNIVGMKNGFGTKKEAFARQYVAEIANPQSDSQMNQRVKMLPAVLFRRQLAEVISRAWEGKKYGGQSIREFMKYAMKEPWTNVPQLAKDSSIAIPGAYLVSKGSLPTINVTYDEDHIKTNLNCPSESFDETIGSLCTILLENNDFLREGDQLTFIAATSPTGVPYVKYSVYSIFIDPSNTDELRAAGSVYPIIMDNVLTVFTDDQLMLGGTVVLSRDGQSNQRSTQRFVVATDFLSTYFAASLKTSVAETYKSTTASRGSSDWPYDDSAEASVATEDGEYTLSGLTGAAAAKNGTKVKVKYVAGTTDLYAVYAFSDSETVLVGSQPFCVGTNGRPVSYTDGGDETGLSISAVPALANLRQIAIS